MSISPFVKWAGGKRQIMNYLLEYMPKKYRHYYEPFVGGGALLMELEPIHATINDSNKELMYVYKCLRNKRLFKKFNILKKIINSFFTKLQKFFIVSFSTVGAIFGAFGWFNSKAMKAVYFIVSTIVSFITAYVVWRVEQHILVVGIVLGIIALLAVAFIVVSIVVDKKSNKEEDEQKE